MQPVALQALAILLRASLAEKEGYEGFHLFEMAVF